MTFISGKNIETKGKIKELDWICNQQKRTTKNTFEKYFMQEDKDNRNSDLNKKAKNVINSKCVNKYKRAYFSCFVYLKDVDYLNNNVVFIMCNKIKCILL